MKDYRIVVVGRTPGKQDVMGSLDVDGPLSFAMGVLDGIHGKRPGADVYLYRRKEPMDLFEWFELVRVNPGRKGGGRDDHRH